MATHITIREAAAMIGCNERHVRVLAANGTLRGEKFGKLWRISRKSAEQFRLSNTKGRPKSLPASDLPQS